MGKRWSRHLSFSAHYAINAHRCEENSLIIFLKELLQYVPYVLQHNKERIVYATNWKQKDKGTKPLIHEKYSNDDYAITLTKPLILQHWQVMYIAPTNIEIQHNHWLTLPIIKYSSFTELIQFPCNQKSLKEFVSLI